MKIGIIGTGNVGNALGKIFANLGHEIMFGSRNPQKAIDIANKIGTNTCGGSYSEAAKFGDLVILAVHWDAVKDSVQAAGNLNGKILVDCVNPLAPRLSGLSIGLSTSAAEELAKLTPGAKVVKAFNTTGTPNYFDPQFGSQKASGFICGDDKDAKSTVAKLVEEMGFDVIDAGPLKNARLLEPLAMLWIDLAYVQGFGPNIAFKLLKR